MFCDQDFDVSLFWDKELPGSDPGGFHHEVISSPSSDKEKSQN